MATEQERADLSLIRGKQAAKMSTSEAREYAKGSAKMDKDYQRVAEETAGVSKKQQTQEILGSMKKGGTVKATGVYKLHKGEKVVPKHMIAHGPNKNMIHAKSSANHRRYDFGKE